MESICVDSCVTIILFVLSLSMMYLVSRSISENNQQSNKGTYMQVGLQRLQGCITRRRNSILENWVLKT